MWGMRYVHPHMSYTTSNFLCHVQIGFTLLFMKFWVVKSSCPTCTNSTFCINLKCYFSSKNNWLACISSSDIYNFRYWAILWQLGLWRWLSWELWVMLQKLLPSLWNASITSSIASIAVQLRVPHLLKEPFKIRTFNFYETARNGLVLFSVLAATMTFLVLMDGVTISQLWKCYGLTWKV